MTPGNIYRPKQDIIGLNNSETKHFFLREEDYLVYVGVDIRKRIIDSQFVFLHCGNLVYISMDIYRDNCFEEIL